MDEKARAVRVSVLLDLGAYNTSRIDYVVVGDTQVKYYVKKTVDLTEIFLIRRQNISGKNIFIVQLVCTAVVQAAYSFPENNSMIKKGVSCVLTHH